MVYYCSRGCTTTGLLAIILGALSRTTIDGGHTHTHTQQRQGKNMGYTYTKFEVSAALCALLLWPPS